MNYKKKLSEIITELANQAQKMQSLVEELSKVNDALEAEDDAHASEKTPGAVPPKIIPFHSPESVLPYAKTDSGRRRRHRAAKCECRIVQTQRSCTRLLAAPGKPLAKGFTDYRLNLQHDGLLLLSWDKRITEMGERYTAYWVTSIGIPRFYASKALPEKDFPFARPDRKSYAAEDGIEFYGLPEPQYIVHVAPELMMNNPKHRELRAAHIQTLKNLGSTVDFEYKYLLKTEKEKRKGTPKNTDPIPTQED